MMRKTTLALAIATCLAAPGWSQDFPVYQETGTIAITFGDEQMIHYTTGNSVPGQPGREVHTASWIVLEPRLLGGMNITPNDVFVTITSRGSIDPDPGQATLRVEASLDPETLDLKASPAPSISFHPDDGNGLYAMTVGVFEIESVTRIDADSFAIIANARGVMTGQTNWDVVHNPDDAVEFSARFDLRRVVNRRADPLP
jgi:hypothetical protein